MPETVTVTVTVTVTQNGASLLEAIVGRRQWCFIFWDSFGNRETPNLSDGPLCANPANAC